MQHGSAPGRDWSRVSPHSCITVAQLAAAEAARGGVRSGRFHGTRPVLSQCFSRSDRADQNNQTCQCRIQNARVVWRIPCRVKTAALPTESNKAENDPKNSICLALRIYVFHFRLQQEWHGQFSDKPFAHKDRFVERYSGIAEHATTRLGDKSRQLPEKFSPLCGSLTESHQHSQVEPPGLILTLRSEARIPYLPAGHIQQALQQRPWEPHRHSATDSGAARGLVKLRKWSRTRATASIGVVASLCDDLMPSQVH